MSATKCDKVKRGSAHVKSIAVVIKILFFYMVFFFSHSAEIFLSSASAASTKSRPERTYAPLTVSISTLPRE